MDILSLKGILIRRLNEVFSNDYEAIRKDFTKLGQGTTLPYALCRLHPAQPSDQDVHWPAISLTQKRNGLSVLYLSALPQKLAQKPVKEHNLQKGLTLAEISQQTVQQLNKARQEQSPHNLCGLAQKRLESDLSYQLWAEFQIETQRPGWVAFRLSPRGVALWLQHAQQPLHRLPADSLSPDKMTPDRQRLPPAETEAVIWQMQYTHARCCTLLKLWQAAQPDQSRRALLTNSQPLSVSTSQAHQLIQALIATADDMFWIPNRWPDRQYALLLKRAASLCHSFDEFYRGCLYGFSQISPTASPTEIVQFEARLGLVVATKNLLNVLLCQHFKLASPASL